MKNTLPTILLAVLTMSTAWAASPAARPDSLSASDEIIAKMKAALSPLFQENQDYTMSDVTVAEASGGYKLSGTATFFQVSSVTFVGTFSTADLMARFELQFPAGSTLPNDIQQKLAKQNFVKWIPADIEKVVQLKSLYLELAENTIRTVGIQFAGQQAWRPVSGIAADDIRVDFNLNNPLGAVSISSTLRSNLKMGEVGIAVSATLSSNPADVVLKGDVSSLSLGGVLGSMGVQKAPEWPDAIWNLAMSKGTVSMAPFAKTLSLNTTSDFGQVEFFINVSASPAEFLLGVAPPPDFTFTRFDASLGVLDHLGLKNTAIVLASSTQKTKLNL